MTVLEAIERLKTMPPHLKVVVNMGKNELANGKEARIIEYVEAYKSDDVFHIAYYESDEEIEQVVNIVT